MSAAHELAALAASVKRARGGLYVTPWYLVLGRSGCGKTTGVLRMHLDWSAGGTLPPVAQAQLGAYHVAAEAVFLEPGPHLTAHGSPPEALTAYCAAIKSARPREPVDGVLLVLSAADFVDLGDAELESYALAMRAQLVAAESGFEAEVPTYVLLTRFDTLWGFGEAFQWGPERAREEPWGFVLPESLGGADFKPRLREQLDGLLARFEAHCFARLASDDHPEARARVFQHLAEVRELVQKTGYVLERIATGSAFEKAPWVRSLAVGSAVPGVGDRLRARLARFTNMGLVPAAPAAIRPGGLPFHAYVRAVLLPERDLVPTRVRFRDDVATVALAGLAAVLTIVATVAAIVPR